MCFVKQLINLIIASHLARHLKKTGIGAVIPCTYVVRHESKQLIIDVVKTALIKMPEGDFIRLEKCRYVYVTLKG